MSQGIPARVHHYRFVHQTFAQAAFQFGPRLIALAKIKDATVPVMAIWDSVGELLDAAERLPSDDLTVSLHSVSAHDVLLVEPPSAQHTPEGHFAAVCAHRDTAVMRYLVLEHSDGSQADATVLGEWTEDGTHLNLGPSAPPQRDAFLLDLQTRLG